MAKVLVHADGGGCHGTPLNDDNVCPKCGIHPDTQSTEFWEEPAMRMMVFNIPANPTDSEMSALRTAKQAESLLKAEGLLIDIPNMSDVTIKVVG